MDPRFLYEQTKWRDELIRLLPCIFQDDARKHHDKAFKKNVFEANTELRQLSESLHLKGVGLSVMAPRGAVEDYADSLTTRLEMELHDRHKGSTLGAIAWLVGEVEKRGFEFPLDLSKSYDKTDLIAAIARVLDPAWWVRKIIKLQIRKIEEVARRMGVVGEYRSPYVSDWALAERTGQKERNRRILSGLVAENDEGQSYTLQELADLSTSNPELRRSELMTRMRGFENVANHLGHMALFLTLTTPSRFHPVLKKKGHPINPKWTNETVQDGQKWLVKTWAKIRAALDRRGFGVYGFRVAEPHHDGTPHWHMILFCQPKHRQIIPLIIDNYARGIKRPRYKLYKAGKRKGQMYIQHQTGTVDKSCDGFERGAKKYRTDCVEIDPSKGSATGYMTKYIAKNIDGFEVDVDHETGQAGNESARRVDAWAATHSVRQFQQIGGPSVGVWREMRRLKADELAETTKEHMVQMAIFFKDEPDDSTLFMDKVIDPTLKFERIFEAADSGDWEAFVQQMGGPIMRRDDRPVKLEKLKDGETRYGEEKYSIKGLFSKAFSCVTRFYSWSIRRIDAVKDALASTRSSVNNCTADAEERRLIELDYQRGAGGLPAI